MSKAFVEWATEEWPAEGRIALDYTQSKRLCAIDVPFSSDQALSRVKALVALVNERWGASEPTGLATAHAALAFLKTEADERDCWWKRAPITVEDVEHYLCIALGVIVADEENIGIAKSWEMYPIDDAHESHATTPEEDACEVCRRHYGFQDMHENEVKNTLVAMIIRAHEISMEPQDLPGFASNAIAIADETIARLTESP